MEAHSSKDAQVIQISEDHDETRNPGGSKICSEAPCGFADAGSISKDSEMLQPLPSPYFRYGLLDGKLPPANRMDYLE